MKSNQTKYINTFIVFAFININYLIAQKADSSTVTYQAADPMEIDFLSGYYEQDGTIQP